jgi:flagellar hook-basal body complex protein FliE
MNAIQSIASLATSANSLASAIPAAASTPASAAQTGATPFGDLMSDAIGSVNNLEAQAKSAVDGLMSGTGVDVHQAMIATQKADMAFEMVLAVRNKAVAAYQSVMGMQF